MARRRRSTSSRRRDFSFPKNMGLYTPGWSIRQESWILLVLLILLLCVSRCRMGGIAGSSSYSEASRLRAALTVGAVLYKLSRSLLALLSIWHRHRLYNACQLRIFECIVIINIRYSLISFLYRFVWLSFDYISFWIPSFIFVSSFQSFLIGCRPLWVSYSVMFLPWQNNQSSAHFVYKTIFSIWLIGPFGQKIPWFFLWRSCCWGVKKGKPVRCRCWLFLSTFISHRHVSLPAEKLIALSRLKSDQNEPAHQQQADKKRKEAASRVWGPLRSWKELDELSAMGASAVRKREKWKWLLPSSAQTTTSGTHEETFRPDDIRLSPCYLPCYSSSTARPPRWNSCSFTCLLVLAFLLQTVSALPPVIRIGTKRNWIIRTQLQVHLFSTSFFIKKVVHKKENWMFPIDFTLYTLSAASFDLVSRPRSYYTL